MNCKKCGTEIPQDSRFCSQCGKKVNAQMPLWGWLIIGVMAVALIVAVLYARENAHAVLSQAENAASGSIAEEEKDEPAPAHTVAPHEVADVFAATPDPVWPPLQSPSFAEQASADSLFDKGMAYLNKGEYFNGLAYIGMAANEGSYSAQFRLYVTYSGGDGGMPQEDIVAAYWNKVRNLRSANPDDPTAGKGVLNKESKAHEYDRSIVYFRDHEYAYAIAYLGMLANEGDASAQYLLGQCYMEGVTKDRYAQFSVEYDALYAAGIYWMQLAAEQGHCCAQGYLGYCYRTGRGVERDLAAAFCWDRLSAKQGCPFGLIHIGYFYADPEDELQFVEKNYDIARMFYEAAETAGHHYAGTRLGELEDIIATASVQKGKYIDELDVLSAELEQKEPEALIRMRERSEGVTIETIIFGGQKPN